MNRLFVILFALACAPSPVATAAQLIAGSAEERLFLQISSEANPDAKLQRLADFEKQFPNSRALPNVYLMAIDILRDKGDRARVIEYGEKVLKLDEKNVTAMMVLSRNYGIERKNLDRAAQLAQRAIDEINRLKASPGPTSQTDAQWKDYLQSTEAAAQTMLQYVKSIQAHELETARREAR